MRCNIIGYQVAGTKYYLISFKTTETEIILINVISDNYYIVRSFEICRASHVIKSWKYPCAEIRAAVDLKLAVFIVKTTNNIKWKFKVENLSDTDTEIFWSRDLPAKFQTCEL